SGGTLLAATSTAGLPAAIVAAADVKTGIVKSTDGGATWKRTLPSSGGGADATALVQANPTYEFGRWYAALGAVSGDARNGVYRSTDNGETWTLVPGPWSSLPADRVGRISLAMGSDDPHILYVSIQDKLHPTKQLHDGELL